MEHKQGNIRQGMRTQHTGERQHALHKDYLKDKALVAKDYMRTLKWCTYLYMRPYDKVLVNIFIAIALLVLGSLYFVFSQVI